ncbi:hypothetical protein [Companilactobacillus sp. DQM5]|uniref:hypothetical protein n=1 Tax=Companilactobacillus sp. DQM5 TaxID=3463359 RepID=UPI0040588DB7
MNTTYLTFAEFKKMGFDIDENNFDDLYKRAMDQLLIVTRRFYQFNDFEKDYTFRKDAYKLALAYQVMYMYSQSVSSADDVANKPNSVSQSIDGTSVSKTFSNTTSSNSSGVSRAVSQEALNQLSGTGLLYRGVEYD